MKTASERYNVLAQIYEEINFNQTTVLCVYSVY